MILIWNNYHEIRPNYKIINYTEAKALKNIIFKEYFIYNYKTKTIYIFQNYEEYKKFHNYIDSVKLAKKIYCFFKFENSLWKVVF